MADVHDFDLAIFGENHQVVGNCDEVARGDSPLSSLKVKGGGLLRHPPYLGFGHGRIFGILIALCINPLYNEVVRIILRSFENERTFFKK